MIWLIWTVSLLTAIWIYLRKKYSYFAERGIKHLESVPVLGNLSKSTLRLEHISQTTMRIYNAFPQERYVGMYEFMAPVVLVRDPELIKQIAVKDFDHFLDHRVRIDEDVDPLFGRNLFSLKGQKWRDMRSTLSPAFTASKMRGMYTFIGECAEHVANSIDKECRERNVEYIDLEMKDLFTRYTNDVIASCAFGLKVDSITEKDNSFYKMGKTASTFTGLQILKFFGYTSFPSFMKLCRFTLFSESTSKFFRDLVQSTMKNREEQKIHRPDMIHLLMEAKKGNLRHETKSQIKEDGFATVEESSVGKSAHKTVWTDDDLIAQAVVFFVAGFDTSATLMNFLAYELARNPHVQRRLQQEVDASVLLHGDDSSSSYNVVQQLGYLDMVVSECLRMWSPAVIMDRLVTKPYRLGPSREGASNGIDLSVGQGVWILVHALHHDAKYWPDPERFDPERFSDDNKHNIQPFTYLPFGTGPRNCIGSRFALLETKSVIYHLLSKFDIVFGPKTPVPIKLDTETFNLRIKGGCWLRLKLRETQSKTN